MNRGLAPVFVWEIEQDFRFVGVLYQVWSDTVVETLVWVLLTSPKATKVTTTVTYS